MTKATNLHFNIADKIHEVAMELADLADIARIKGKKEEQLQNLKLAYFLEKEAALRLQSEPDENEWKFLFLKSAGWLACQLGLYSEALELAELGLKGTTTGVAQHHLEELKKNVLQKMTEQTTKQSFISTDKHFYGLLASADVEQEKVKIKDKNNQQYHILIASKDLIQKTARYLIGEFVEIDTRRNEDGLLVLERIQQAA